MALVSKDIDSAFDGAGAKPYPLVYFFFYYGAKRIEGFLFRLYCDLAFDVASSLSCLCLAAWRSGA